MQGELTVEQVKEIFFTHFDSCAVMVRAAQAQRLTERLQARGFNTLYG